MKGFFDLAAPGYDRLMRWCGLTRPRLFDGIFPSVNGWEVADLGGGTGFYARILAARGARVTVVDTAAAMLARIPAGTGITAIRADLAATGLAAAAFDLVLLIDVLHHLACRPAALAEAVRLLRPGGALVIADVPRHGGLRGFGRRVCEYPFCRIDAFVDPETLERELQTRGVVRRTLEVRPTNFVYRGVKL